MAVLTGLLMLPCLLQAQKKSRSKKTDLIDPVQRELIHDAAIASESGELDRAQELLTEALDIHHDNEIANLRSHLRLLQGDTAGYCADLRWVAYGKDDGLLKKFEQHCIRTDTIRRSDPEFRYTLSPDVVTAVRTHHRADDRTDHRFFDHEGKVVFAFNTSGSDTIFMLCDQMPQFPGGDPELFSYLGRSVRYPAAATDHGLSGVVYVRFTVDTNGDHKDHHLVRSVHWSLDEEALRVVRAMPKWQPGVHQDKRVPVFFNLPLRFTLR